MRYEVRSGGRGFRHMWFFTVYDEDGEKRVIGGASSVEGCHEAAQAAMQRIQNPTPLDPLAGGDGSAQGRARGVLAYAPDRKEDEPATSRLRPTGVTMSTEAPMIAINVEGWSTVSGSRVGLALDPESKEVYSYYSIGAGTPMPVYLNQHISLGGVPVNAVPESLSEWLEGQKEALEAVLAEYKGTEWDGNNYVGQWSEDAREATYAFSEELSRATNDNSIATYWGASDYFFNACSVEDLLDEIGEQDFDTYCQEQVEEAKSNGAYLEMDDVESTLRDAIQDAYNEHQSDIEDYGEGDLTEAQAATAARVLG